MRTFIRYNLFTLVWAFFIFCLTLMPGKYMPPTSIWDFLSFDKFAHFFVFAILVFLMLIGFIKQRTYPYIRFKAYKMAFGISLCYGLFIEVCQSFVPGRSFDVQDILANAIGCILGLGLFYVVYKL